MNESDMKNLIQELNAVRLNARKYHDSGDKFCSAAITAEAKLADAIAERDEARKLCISLEFALSCGQMSLNPACQSIKQDALKQSREVIGKWKD
jgi:hypothetical protein